MTASDSSASPADRPLVAVLDYGIGNLRSAQKALEHVGADARLTADAGLVADADAVVLPGVGAFGACMDALRATGLDAVAVAAAASGRPFLGICVGMQLLYDGSDESPGVPGLGVLPGVLRLLPDGREAPADAVEPCSTSAGPRPCSRRWPTPCGCTSCTPTPPRRARTSSPRVTTAVR